ncbi:MAG: type IV pilus assembly protein PilM [Planctomycetota bacterium]|nr:type IV pilus assembly protein PilM [Planctomycetota bacterium]MDA1212178.1 type IV pilus assembly protein PilM [Planctomycetota bacterium]
MAETRAVWGIDIGQAGLKAIKLQYNDGADRVMALAFDYIPHAKILSQPDAVPEELIAQALEKFLSRNDVRGDVVAMSVPGQTALARFIQLPPVEAGKVAEIVKYEAKQQIPFDLDDVIWDYQPLSSGTEESGYLLDAEVGLFAMKRDQVMNHLKPYTNAKIEVDLIQIAPLAMFNLLSYDHLGIKSKEDDVAEDEFTMLIDMGCDTSTILISNGKKIWIRNVPIGGNHFTRALTKEMKLTFAKAEHLKCNATKSPDPRAVFQALRPVFNDYVAEIQRSIGFFSSVNRDSKIVKVLGLGNGFKLAGLQKFLQQNLQYDVERVETFHAAIGDAVLNAPLMQENVMSFGVAYGLGLQSLKLTSIHTSLLPPELITARKIRRKKPWAVATAATLLVGFSISMIFNARVAATVSTEKWSVAEANLASVKGEMDGYKASYGTAEGKYKTLQETGQKLVGNIDTREYWLEIYRAINACLPRDPLNLPEDIDISERKRMKIHSITCEKVPDLKVWYEALPQTTKDRMNVDGNPDKDAPPEGEGYVFKLEGVHYRHDKNDTSEQGVLYIGKTLIKNLQSWVVTPDQGVGEVPVRKIGITHPVVTRNPTSKPIQYDPRGNSQDLAGGFPGAMDVGRGGLMPGRGGAGVPGGAGFPGAGRGAFPGAGFGATAKGAGGLPGRGARNSGAPSPVDLRVTDPTLGGYDPNSSQPEMVKGTMTEFTLEFIWKPTPRSERPDIDPIAGAPAAAPAEGAQPAPPSDSAPAADINEEKAGE